jgi:hypothetical protein
MLFRFVLSIAIATCIAFAPSTLADAQERPSKSTPTSKASATQKPTPQSVTIVIDEKISVADFIQSSSPVLMDESIGVLDTTTSSNVILNEHVSIDDQMESNSHTMGESLSVEDSMDLGVKSNPNAKGEKREKTDKAEKSSQSSNCTYQSGGRSSFGSIGLLTAPLALYVWRRMRKF